MANREEVKNALNEGYSKKIGEINDLWSFLEDLQESEGFHGFTVNGSYGINSSINKTIERLSHQLEEERWSAFWLVSENGKSSFTFFRYGIVKLDETIYRLGKLKSKEVDVSKVQSETES